MAAAGELPWSCTEWKGLDAEGIASLKRETGRGHLGEAYIHIPSSAYHEGDPRFWRAGLKIDWEDKGADENATGGARASGIKVSRTHLLALLPEEPRSARKCTGLACGSPPRRGAEARRRDPRDDHEMKGTRARLKIAAAADRSLRGSRGGRSKQAPNRASGRLVPSHVPDLALVAAADRVATRIASALEGRTEAEIVPLRFGVGA